MMKILTLNTHSIVEVNYEEKLRKFVEMIKAVSPDIVALQEVNQSLAAAKLNRSVREDNHAYRVAKLLKEAGASYYWSWIPIKIGYDILEEGMAVFSKTLIENTDSFFVSTSRNYCNWKTRKVLGIYTKDMWFYSVHMGWWDDEDEPFRMQWDQVVKQLKQRKETCFVMGDFNSPAESQKEGYDYVLHSGWLDTWQMAEKKDIGITVGGVIDGWRQKTGETSEPGENSMRIDYIFCNKKVKVKSSEVVCNGMNYDIVSDHYGVLVEVEI